MLLPYGGLMLESFLWHGTPHVYLCHRESLSQTVAETMSAHESKREREKAKKMNFHLSPNIAILNCFLPSKVASSVYKSSSRLFPIKLLSARV